MSLIGKNIKKIRSVKKLSQAQFAELFDLTRGSIGAYEEERAEPKVDTIIQMANYFGLTIDLLLNKELTMNELFSLDIVKEKLDQAHEFDKAPAKPFSTSGIRLVKINQYAEYIVNHGNRDFVSGLVSIDLPIDFKGVSRAFELNGSEMEYHQNGLHHGDILLTKKIDLRKPKFEVNRVYVIVMDSEILIRRLGSVDVKVMSLTADDPNYAAIKVDRTTILESWEVRGAYSTYLNPPKMMEEKLMLLEQRMSMMESEFQRMKKS